MHKFHDRNLLAERKIVSKYSLTLRRQSWFLRMRSVVSVLIIMTVTKVITASILKVVIKDRCVFKKWLVPDSHRAVSRIELLRS